MDQPSSFRAWFIGLLLLVGSPQVVAQVPAQGHAQLFVPWTFLDRVAFELVRARALRSIPVSDPDGSGPLRAFTIHVVPTAVPRVQPAASSPDSVMISFAARMGAGPGAGVWMAVQNVTLTGLTGQIRFAATNQSLAPYQGLLQNAINAALQQRGMNRIPLAPRTMQLVAPLSLPLGPPTAGPRYLRLPLTDALSGDNSPPPLARFMELEMTASS